MAELPEGHAEACAEVIAKIRSQAAVVGTRGGASGTDHDAAALAHLAEAYAWLRSPGQPHGGSTNLSTS